MNIEIKSRKNNVLSKKCGTCVLVLSLLLSIAITFGPPTSIAATSEDSGPKMDDIEKWFKKELPSLGGDHIIRKKGDFTDGNTYTINKAILSECTLTIQQTISNDLAAPFGWATTATIPLKNIDLSKLSSGESGTWPGYTQNKPSYAVSVSALPDVPPFSTVSIWANNKKQEKTKTVTYLAIVLRDEASSHRLEGYLRSAATLCGAPDTAAAAARQPTVTAPKLQMSSTGTSAEAAPMTSMATSKPAAGGMTNADVIAMVNAGLSDLVIANSIRQAADRSFDLSPSGLVGLKKAKVSDSVIIVMQSGPSVDAVVPAPAATKPPKYDAALTQKYEADKTAAKLAATGCTGIEMMGLFENKIFDRAMGGGITEWLVKIRNNTAVTKIVVFGWRDQYGQEQTSQVQIRGGEIASVRVDMTQARYIAPTADVKLVSCQ